MKKILGYSGSQFMRLVVFIVFVMALIGWMGYMHAKQIALQSQIQNLEVWKNNAHATITPLIEVNRRKKELGELGVTEEILSQGDVSIIAHNQQFSAVVPEVFRNSGFDEKSGITTYDYLMIREQIDNGAEGLNLGGLEVHNLSAQLPDVVQRLDEFYSMVRALSEKRLTDDRMTCFIIPIDSDTIKYRIEAYRCGGEGGGALYAIITAPSGMRWLVTGVPIGYPKYEPFTKFVTSLRLY